MKTNEKIRARRIELGLTQDQLSRKSGVSDISLFETCKKKPTLATLVKLSKVLECELNYLINDT